jgi:catechol 2,3-dioxygenase-like lactoylglutathione lyase family enzyme
VFDHVTIRVSDRAASERFYDTVLGVIGIERTATGELPEWNDFSLVAASAEEPVTRGLHIGFGAKSRDDVDAFWRAGVDAGFESDGEPGPRPIYGDDYYGGFLLDPDGNSIEAVHFEGSLTGMIDHLWIRVADVAASKRFYETIAPHARIGLRHDTPERAGFNGDTGSFSVLTDDHVTENLHMAFPASDNQAVDDFHEAALEAGYRDNGAPGERPEYLAGYYGAFVLDPDGNNIELVSHNR